MNLYAAFDCFVTTTNRSLVSLPVQAIDNDVIFPVTLLGVAVMRPKIH